MTEDEHFQQAVDSALRTIADCDKQIAAGRTHIALVLSNRRPPTGLRARLTKGAGPTGDICNYMERDGVGEIVAMFDPKKVRDFLLRELAKIEALV